MHSVYASDFEFIDNKYFFLTFDGKYKYEGDIKSGPYLEIIELTSDTLKLYECWDDFVSARNKLWTLSRAKYEI